MAAGMGSRYGGLKQIDPVDEDGHIIVDFSLFDAKKAGFEKVVFVIKQEIEKEFKEVIGNRTEKYMDVSYVYQELNDLPEGYQVPQGRVKPWGTAHAVLSCRNEVKGPFAVINADDYYGSEAFSLIYAYLSTHEDDEKYRYAMVGYELGKTVTDNGSISRGICEVDQEGDLAVVCERTRIEKREDGIAYTEDNGKTWIPLAADTIVSMNMWGFTESLLKELAAQFPTFLDENLGRNPLKCEYFLPSVVSALVNDGRAAVQVLKTADQWFGVTYKEDKPVVVAMIGQMKKEGRYPEHLWEAEEWEK